MNTIREKKESAERDVFAMRAQLQDLTSRVSDRKAEMDQQIKVLKQQLGEKQDEIAKLHEHQAKRDGKVLQQNRDLLQKVQELKADTEYERKKHGGELHALKRTTSVTISKLFD